MSTALFPWASRRRAMSRLASPLAVALLLAALACNSSSIPDAPVADSPPQAPPTCPGKSVIGSLASPPTISMDPLASGASSVSGVVRNVDPRTSRVVIFALTNRWYVQPITVSPYTSICSNASWKTTTHPWSRLVALLVDSTYRAPEITDAHPAFAPGVLAWAQYPAASSPNPILFSGYAWAIKATAAKFDPGPNFWSDSSNSVWSDSSGLHLAIARQNSGWTSAEVQLTRSLGYGEYTWQIASRLDALDPVAVFSPFLYESPTREIDAEFSRSLAGPDGAQFVVQPYTRAGNRVTFRMPSAPTSTVRITWRASRIDFAVWSGWGELTPTSAISSWSYAGPDIPPPGGERVHMNLWLVGGAAPTSGKGDEVVVKSFSFRP